MLVRPRSALGLKYVEITKGNSRRGLRGRRTIPRRRATREPVEFDEFFHTFDDPTRGGAGENLIEFGDGFAGRGGTSTRRSRLPALLRNLEPVMRNLVGPETDLGGSSGRSAHGGEVAPVAEEQASLFRNLDRTFEAFADVARPYIQESIDDGPADARRGDRGVPGSGRSCATASGCSASCARARALRGAAPPLADAIEVGTPTLRRSVALNRRLEPTFTPPAGASPRTRWSRSASAT